MVYLDENNKVTADSVEELIRWMYIHFGKNLIHIKFDGMGPYYELTNSSQRRRAVELKAKPVPVYILDHIKQSLVKPGMVVCQDCAHSEKLYNQHLRFCHKWKTKVPIYGICHLSKKVSDKDNL